jgi:hypothetical protein
MPRKNERVPIPDHPLAPLPDPSAGVPRFHRRLLPILGLLLLPPYCAELLSQYGGPVTDPVELLVGMLLLAPLYGTIAVLIREFARRAGRSWPTILLLATAFGVVQAGLIDQTLFNHESFNDSPFWDGLPTIIPGLDMDAGQLLTFVGGHVIWSFAAPIAVVEACVPRLADRPWLGKPGIAVMAALYLVAALFFYSELVVAEGYQADPAHLIGAAAVVAALIVVAFAMPRRRKWHEGRVPPPWSLGLLSLGLFMAGLLVPQSWAGVGITAVAFAVLAGLLGFWSSRAAWTRTHVLAAAGGALVAMALIAYLVDPLGASLVAKYVSSSVVLLALLALLAWGWRRTGAWLLRRGAVEQIGAGRDPAG